MSAAIEVALIQDHHRGSAEANLAAIEEQLEAAAADGAQLVLLQELHNGPYFCQRQAPEEFDRAEAIPGPTSERLGAAAKRLGIVIVASLFERRAAGLYHNTAVVLERDGSLVGKYRKMHIPDDPGYLEKFYFTPGDLGFHPIQTSVGKLGVLVCWDQWYPEAARLMALAGADVLLYPTAIGWDVRDSETERRNQRQAWILAQRGHAVSNGIPVMSCNRTGVEQDPTGRGPGIRFWGSSFICGPQGEFLAEAETDQPQLLRARLDLRHTEDVRRMWPFLRDRRIDAYQDLLKRFRD